MLLSKIKASRSFSLWRDYSAWLIFCEIVLILTNGFASLILIRDYRFSAIDVLLTYGLLIFLCMIEASAGAAIMVIIEEALERVFHTRLDLIFRGLLVIGFTGTWLILLLTLLHKV